MNVRLLSSRNSSGRAVFIAVLSVCLGGALAEGQTKEVFTPEHVARIRQVSSCKLSPDGRHIAYVLQVPRKPFEDDDGPEWAELHVVDVAGQSRPFITGEVNVGAMDWTPDGSGISFLAKRGEDEHKALYVIPIDGGEARKVIDHDSDISRYTWSPDGLRVAFIAAEPVAKSRKKQEEKGFKQIIYEEDTPPVHLYVVKVDEDEAEPKALELSGTPTRVLWSPVGNRLVVAIAPTPHIDDSYMKTKVHILDANTGAELGLVDSVGKMGALAWSPDGEHLALIAAEDLHDPSAGRLMVAGKSGGAMRNLLTDYDGQVAAIAWQDADTIMFLGDEHVWTTFGEIRIDGTGRKTHVARGKAVLRGLSLSRDGRTATFRSDTPRHAQDVFVMRHGDASPVRLTDSNPWFRDMQFATQEVVTHKARDGLELEGLLIRPLNEKAGTKYPLILTVHGGPEGHRRDGWLTRYSAPGQVAAARGFAVFFPNYRGGTGRGVAFSKLGQADYGGGEFDDLIDAVDHLIATGLVDRDRVGVTGGSYGGFASAWLATKHTDRFAASVMFVGISDHISKAGTTDIPNEAFLVHARKRLWDDWQFFLERSPIYYVQQARTPILILHGKDDPRVNPGQSLELYRNLKVLGNVPVRLVLYPGEGHGNRKAAPRYDYNLRMLRWFEHYLQGPGGDPPAYEIEYALEEEDDED